MTQLNDLTRYRANWQDEIESAYLYRALAEAEPQPQLAEVYRRLAAVEEQHARFWGEHLRAGGGYGSLTPSWLAYPYPCNAGAPV